MPSQVEIGMIGLIQLFHSYASKGGDPKKLEKKELKTLLQKEFPTFTGECKEPAKLEEFMAQLDMDGDGQMDFNEFMIMVTTMTMMCNQMIAAAQ